MSDRRIWRKLQKAFGGRKPRTGDIGEADGRWFEVTDAQRHDFHEVELRTVECGCFREFDDCLNCDESGEREEWVQVKEAS